MTAPRPEADLSARFDFTVDESAEPVDIAEALIEFAIAYAQGQDNE